MDHVTLLRSSLAEYANFPKQGICYRDLNPLYKDKYLWPLLIGVMEQKLTSYGPFDYVAGVEARGFILGSALALKMMCGFIPVRKKGKLPGNVHSVEYTLEYGADILEMQTDTSLRNSKILIVDDVYATGGTLKAVIELVSKVSQEKPTICVLLDIKISNLKELNLPYEVILD